MTGVVLVDGEGAVRSEVAMGERRPDVSRRVGRAALASGWGGYARANGSVGDLRCYVRIAGDPLLYPLTMTDGVQPCPPIHVFSAPLGFPVSGS